MKPLSWSSSSSSRAWTKMFCFIINVNRLDNFKFKFMCLILEVLIYNPLSKPHLWFMMNSDWSRPNTEKWPFNKTKIWKFSLNLNLELWAFQSKCLFNLDDEPRLDQASHWEVTKHHLQAAKHNISSESLTPSGHHHEDNENEDDGDVEIKGKQIMHPWMITLPYFQRPAPQVWT